MRNLIIIPGLILIVFLVIPVYAYTGELHVKAGDYVYIRGSPATVNGHVPPTYTGATVLVSDQGCIYTGLQQPYRGSSIMYGDSVAAHYNLHSVTGELRLTPGKYFEGIRIDLVIPEGYKGTLMHNTYGNGTHLILNLCMHGSCFPAVWRLPVSLPVAYKTVSGLGTGWYISAYGPSQGLYLDLRDVKVVAVKGDCPTPTPDTPNQQMQHTSTQSKPSVETSNNTKALIALGAIPLLLAAIIYAVKH